MKPTVIKAIALVSCITAAVHAEENITVQTRDNGAALVNPGMGWVVYFYSNVPANYGSRLSPADTVDDFPGLSTVFLRIPWAYLEPKEGKFNWALLDTPAQRWISKGKRIALCLTSSENWMPYATPEWVKNAKMRPLLTVTGEQIMALLPDDPESILAKLKKNKPGAPPEDAPAEGDDSKTPAPPTRPSQRSDSTPSIKPADKQKLDALTTGTPAARR